MSKKYPFTSLSDAEYEAILNGSELDYDDARDLQPFNAMERPTTQLNKTVKRVSSETVRDAGKLRPIVVAIHPSGYIGLRMLGTRREEVLSIVGAYELAVKARVMRERAEKKAQKGTKR